MSARDETAPDTGEGITGEDTTPATDGRNVLRNLAFIWGAALVALVFAYIGVTNTNFSPTILGELLFGTLAVVLLIWGLGMFINR